nr:MAG: imidazole glycerol phosphate synthase subunit HisH [Hyphomicrobiales bacterium]
MAPLVTIIDHGSGNLRSAEKALERASQEAGTGQEIIVTSDPDKVASAERIVLPGVGAFADCMRGLSGIPGMVDVISEMVLKRGKPFLGICVGMQMLASIGREHGNHDGLGWIEGEVAAITPRDASLKIPHMGWNELNQLRPHPLLDNLADKAHVYFVHSFGFVPKDEGHLLATTDYAGAISAVVGRDNIAGTQFHPEKSQAVGLAFLGRFLKWRP